MSGGARVKPGVTRISSIIKQFKRDERETAPRQRLTMRNFQWGWKFLSVTTVIKLFKWPNLTKNRAPCQISGQKSCPRTREFMFESFCVISKSLIIVVSNSTFSKTNHWKSRTGPGGQGTVRPGPVNRYWQYQENSTLLAKTQSLYKPGWPQLCALFRVYELFKPS